MQTAKYILLSILLLSSIILIVFSVKVFLKDVFTVLDRTAPKKSPDAMDFLLDVAMILVGIGGALLAILGINHV